MADYRSKSKEIVSRMIGKAIMRRPSKLALVSKVKRQYAAVIPKYGVVYFGGN